MCVLQSSKRGALATFVYGNVAAATALAIASVDTTFTVSIRRFTLNIMAEDRRPVLRVSAWQCQCFTSSRAQYGNVGTCWNSSLNVREVQVSLFFQMFQNGMIMWVYVVDRQYVGRRATSEGRAPVCVRLR